jgi:hypothetical protein
LKNKDYLFSGKRLIVFFFLLTATASTIRAQPVLQVHFPSVERWEVFELTFKDSQIYQNPFWDVEITAQFTAPDGQKMNIHGFYFEEDLWKVRFAPTLVGVWEYHVTYNGASGESEFQGSFTCTQASGQNHGFIQVHPEAKHSFVQTDGTLFIPIGLNGHTPAVCGAFLGIPPGPQQVPQMWDTLLDHSVNSFRLMMFHNDEVELTFSWNPDEGCAHLLYQTPALDLYNLRACRLMDRWFEQAKAHNISIYLCLFVVNDIPEFLFANCPWSTSRGGPYNTVDEMYQVVTGPGIELEKKYVAYVVRRWGAYRNLFLWEYNNEYGARCSSDWLTIMDEVISANDPYNRPRTVSFWDSRWSQDSQVNDHSAVTVTDDHFYKFVLDYTEFEGDSAANSEAVYRFQKYAKPVMFGEFGSGAGNESRSDFTFQRVAYWGALVGGGYPLYWLSGMSESPGYQFNMDTLRFLKAVGRVVSRISDYAFMQPANHIVTPVNPEKIRAYFFWNSSECLVYIHNFLNHVSISSGVSLEFDFPGIISCNFSAEWIDTGNGYTLGTENGFSQTGYLNLTAPDFITDLLLLIQLENILILHPPQNFSARQMINRSLSQVEYINILRWQGDPRNVGIIKYRIYTSEERKLELLTEVDANRTEHWHRNVQKDTPVTYAITSLNVDLKESLPVYVTLSQSAGDKHSQMIK